MNNYSNAKTEIEDDILSGSIVKVELEGTVVLGNDGNYYVAVSDESNHKNDAKWSGIDDIQKSVLIIGSFVSDIEKVNALLIDNVEGNQTLILEDTVEKDRFIANRARAKMSNATKQMEKSVENSLGTPSKFDDKQLLKPKTIETTATTAPSQLFAEDDLGGGECGEPGLSEFAQTFE